MIVFTLSREWINHGTQFNIQGSFPINNYSDQLDFIKKRSNIIISEQTKDALSHANVKARN